MESKGIVKWFNAEKGYGFIQRTDADGDVFVHWSGISGDGYRALDADQTVAFDIVKDMNGRHKAVNVQVTVEA